MGHHPTHYTTEKYKRNLVQLRELRQFRRWQKKVERHFHQLNIDSHMQKREPLMLVEVKKIHFTDKETGNAIEKWKYTFINEKNEFFTGYLDTDMLKKYIVEDAQFDAKKAKSFLLRGSVWNNEVKWRLEAQLPI